MDLSRTLRPHSIAVVGASPRSFAGQIVQANCDEHGFTGTVTPINAKYDTIGDRACAPSLSALAQSPDVVVALVGTARVVGIAEEAAAIGAGALIVPGAGFTDSGDAATELARDLSGIAHSSGMRVVGPNCMGLVDLVTGAMPYIGTVPPQVRRGSVAAIAQSGAVIEALVNCGGRVPFSTLVSSGAEAVTTTADLLRFFAHDDETSSVLVFLEGFEDAADLLAAARDVAAADKTVAACFVGRSAAAQDGILAHSGKLAPAARVTEAALEQAGIVLADDLDQLITMGEILGVGRLPAGRRMHAVTNSGGEANLICDIADDAGLDLPSMSEAAARRLSDHWPSFHIANPLDPWGVDAYDKVYPEAIQAVADEPGDILVVSQDQQVTSGAYERTLGLDLVNYLAAAVEESDKLPVLLSPTSQDPDPAVTQRCREAGIALLRGVSPALHALSRLAARPMPTPLVPRTATPVEALTTDNPMTEDRALEVLASVGVATPRQIRVSSPDDVATAAADIDGPVVVKAVAEGLLHKSELGLVQCNLYGPDAARFAAKEILDAGREAGLEVELLVVEQVQGALDVVVGFKRDDQFGPTTLVGLGGVWTEMLDSVSVHVGPMDEAAARRLLNGSQVGRMLSNARGGALDVDGVIRALCAVSDIGQAHPEVVAIDINPIMVSKSRAVAVDAVIQRTTDNT